MKAPSPKAADLIARCSSCGTCQSVCPVYKAGRREQFAARGKIKLIKGLDQGWIDPGDAEVQEALSACLLCGRCQANCPNLVRSTEAIRAVRRDLAREGGAPLAKRLVLETVMPHPERLAALARTGRLALGAARPVLSGLGLKIPGLAGMENLPLPAAQSFLSTAPRTVNGPAGAPTLAFFAGCVINHLRPEVGHRLLELLSRRFNLVIPPEQGCCGLAAASSGLMEAAADMAQQNLLALEAFKADLVVTACGSCAHTLAREAPEYLPENLAERARALGAKVREISQVLAEETELIKGLAAGAGPVAVHDPCHLSVGLGVSAEPRRMLEAAGAEVAVFEGMDQCCGGGGTFALSQPELSEMIISPKAAAVEKSGAGVLATSCSGCWLQWRRNLPGETKVIYPVETLFKE